jgi:ureidoacrylate peracid hydrolase
MTIARPLATAAPVVSMGAAPQTSWMVSPAEVDMTRRAPSVAPLRISAEPQDIVVDARKTALLIVDMQNDFCTEGGWMHSKGIDVSPNRKPIAPLRALVDAFRAARLPVVWANWGVRKDLLNISPSLRHAHNPTGQMVGLAEPVPGTRSEVIARGSWGAEVVDELNPGTADIQITKHRFSAFWDTETDAVLRN